MPEDVRSLMPSSIRQIHACHKTYLLSGPRYEIEKFLSEKKILSQKCLFPKDDWQIEYRYLGDFEINTPVNFKLHINDHNEKLIYNCKSTLPKGLSFANGFLTGTLVEPSNIINIEITVELENKKLETCYMIRFFENVNEANSFLDRNYLKIGYGPKLIDYDANEIYYRLVDPASVKLTAQKPLEAAADAAKKIYMQANGKKIFLCISGGIDSQVMVQSFIAAKIDFQAVLMVDVNNCNLDDVTHARLFTSKFNIKLKEINFDYVDFIKNYKYVEMSRRYRFNNPEYGILLSLMEMLDGYCVYAGRPISVSKSVDNQQVLGLAVDETWSRARYLERTGKIGCPEFLIYTPELVLSFLNTNYAKNFSLNEDWDYSSKLRLLSDAGFDISMAPPIKFTGFENIYKFFKETDLGNEIWLHHRAPLKIRFPNSMYRNAIKISNGSLATEEKIIKTYEDGFSFNYLKKNAITSFH